MTRLMFLATALMLTGPAALAQDTALGYADKPPQTYEDFDKIERVYNDSKIISCSLHDLKGNHIDYMFQPRGDGDHDEVAITKNGSRLQHAANLRPVWHSRVWARRVS